MSHAQFLNHYVISSQQDEIIRTNLSSSKFRTNTSTRKDLTYTMIQERIRGTEMKYKIASEL